MLMMNKMSNYMTMRVSVVQRLNDFRAPVGSEVRFTFSRKVRIDGTDEDEEGASESKADHDDEPHAAPSNYTGESQPSSNHQEEYSGADGDEEGGHFKFSSRTSFIEDRNSGFGRDADYASNDIDEDDAPESPAPSASRPAPVPLPSRVPAASRKSEFGQDPMVQAVSLQAENEELVQRMQELESELIEMTRERDKYRVEAADWRMKYETANHEKIEFLRQVINRMTLISIVIITLSQLGEAEEECQELERRERNALDLLEQVTFVK
jgi:hypothetical protein